MELGDLFQTSNLNGRDLEVKFLWNVKNANFQDPSS